MSHQRPSRLAYFMSFASLASTRSTCLRRQHGAVLVKDGQVLGTGYNGAASGLAHCTEKGECLREAAGCPPGTRYELCVAVHAEANAIAQAAKHGVRTKGADLYVTGQPCLMCARLIVNAGIKEVFFLSDVRYSSSDEPLQILVSGGVSATSVPAKVASERVG